MRRFANRWSAAVLAVLVAGSISASTTTAAPTAAAVPLALAARPGVPAANHSGVTPPTAGGLVTVTPTRLLDTRVGSGAPPARILPGHSLTVRVAGRAPVPATGVAAVVAAVSVVAPSATGFLTAAAAGSGRHATILNFQGQTGDTNTFVLPLGVDGSITLTDNGSATVDLVADVTGYVRSGPASVPGTLAEVGLTRLLDTRYGLGAPKARLGPGRSLTVRFGGRVPIPAAAAASVLAEVTVVSPTAAGFLTAAPAGSGRRATIVNFAVGASTTDTAVLPLGTDGSVTFTNHGSATVDLLADITGYYRAGSASAAGAIASVAPARLLDTRYGTGKPQARLAPGQSLRLPLWGRSPIPAGRAAAVIAAVTVVAPTAPGYLTVGSAGNTPRATILNFAAGTAVTSTTVLPLGPDGAVTFTNQGTATLDLLVDVTGFSLATPAATSPGLVSSGSAHAVGARQIAIGWADPPGPDLAGVMIRRQTGSTAPPTAAAGTLVTTTSAAATGFLDSGVSPDTAYSYALFAFDTSGHLSARVVVGATTSTVDPRNAVDVLSGFDDLWTASRSTASTVFAGQIGQSASLSASDELVSWINQHATAAQQFAALQTADLAGASPGNYDQSITIAPGLGSVLAPLYVQGRESGALPLTAALLATANGSSGAYVQVGGAKNADHYPRPYLATDPAHPPAGEPCPIGDNASALAADRTGLAGADAHRNLVLRRVADTTDSTDEFATGSVRLTANYAGLCAQGSFPSGHTTSAYEDGIVLATLLPELGPEILARASEMGNNRIVLGVHYPLDVIGGRMAAEAGIAAQWSDPSYRADVLDPARQELLHYLTSRCGGSLAECIARSSPYRDDPYGGQVMPGGTAQIVTDRPSAVRVYGERLTYHLPPAEPVGLSPAVPVGADNLLLTTFPTLSSSQRLAVLAQTEIVSGGALDQTGTGQGGSWERLDLAAAMSATVQLDADGSVTVTGTGGQPQVIGPPTQVTPAPGR